MLEIEHIQSNWETYESLCKRLSDHNLNELVDFLGERLVMCPASFREDQYGAYPGGMIEHALKVSAHMRTLNKSLNLGLSVASVLKVGLLHDLGKVGNLEEDYFVNQDSDWHREKLGQFYKFNENLNKMSISHRTLFLLQHFGVKLTNDEWLAIQLAQGSHFEENRFYVGHESTLALILQQSKAMTIHKIRN
jgi:hypothetical protein